MARFQLTASHQFGSNHVRAGRTIADSTANAVAGDFVYTGLNSNTMTDGMTPLDASASTMKAASRFANVAAKTSITGVDSID